MSWLLDTNILLRWAQSSHPMYPLIRQALDRIHEAREEVFITSQNLIEFWNVATRPTERNGFGMSPAQAASEVGQLERTFAMAVDLPEIYPAWRELVEQAGVSGVQVHDARLVAVMRVHGLSRLLTMNIGDFKRYDAIEVVHPLTYVNEQHGR